MAGKPAAASPSGATEQSKRDAQGESAHPRERLGPLALERLSKDDGRALILYSYVEPPRT